jgi:hypothetical protein
MPWTDWEMRGGKGNGIAKSKEGCQADAEENYKREYDLLDDLELAGNRPG